MYKTASTLLFLCLCHWLIAQCPTNITFTTQAQIDSFPVNYPGCTAVEGRLEITGPDITNLDSLWPVTKAAAIEIWNTSLTTLNGLHNPNAARD